MFHAGTISYLMSGMPETADANLIESTLQGDESAFARLVGKYNGMVWGTVHRTLGNSTENEDAVQEIFMRVLVSLRRFDRRLPFGPWLLRIASNYCIDQIRRRKARKYKLWSDLTESEEERLALKMSCKGEAEVRTAEDNSGELKIAYQLLDELRPRRRMAFVLREIEGRSYEEIATILGIPEVTVRVRVSRARSDLQKKYRKHLAGLKSGGRK